jgi:hypothetical protein
LFELCRRLVRRRFWSKQKLLDATTVLGGLDRGFLDLGGVGAAKDLQVCLIERWRRCSLGTDWSKREIRSRFPEGVLTKDTQDGRTYRSTSGTSGERLTVVTNFVRRESGRASALHVLEVATGKSLGMSITDIPPNVCNSICGLAGPPETSFLRHIWKGIRRRS